MLQVKGLSKKYKNKIALDQFEMNVQPGEIIGILGPNGSGKSTLMKIASGIIPKTRGDILVAGLKPGKDTKGKVSYLSDTNAIPETMKVKDVRYFYETFYEDFNPELFMNNLKNLRLADEINNKVKSLSKGMQQKLRLALTMARQSELYLLDEPLGGIDPLAREEILETLITSINDNSTVIITTHLVHDVEQILNRVVFISNGKNIGDYDCETIRYEEGQSISDKYKEVFRNADVN